MTPEQMMMMQMASNNVAGLMSKMGGGQQQPMNQGVSPLAMMMLARQMGGGAPASPGTMGVPGAQPGMTADFGASAGNMDLMRQIFSPSKPGDFLGYPMGT